MNTTTTAAHTPGPWTAERCGHQQEFSHWVSSMSKHVMPRQSTVAGVVNAGAESDANARLISAAPDLLAALIITRGQWIHSVNAEQCLAALAKAEGAV